METLTERILTGARIDEETLSAAELRMVIEGGVEFDRMQRLVRLATEQVHAAEWLMNIAEIRGTDYDFSRAGQEAEEYHRIYDDYFRVLVSYPTATN